MDSSPPSILLLSGAGLPEWIWDGVRSHLEGSHETQVAPRPTGLVTGIRDYVNAALESAPAGPFAIVAHSAGGVVGAELFRLAPERVTGILGVCAVVPPSGGSFITAMPVPNRWLLNIAMRLAGTRPPESAIRKTLAHGLDEQTIDRLIADFTPEPQSYFRERIGEQAASGARGYAVSTADRELPATLQRRFAAHLGATWQHELPTGHLPMLENPAALAKTISRFFGVRADPLG